MYDESLDDDLYDGSDSENEEQAMTQGQVSGAGTPAGQRDGPSYRLCMSSRNLEAIPTDSYSVAPYITDLDLSGNLLSILTIELEPFQRLRQLDVSSNQLSKLGEGLASLYLLKILLCKNNQLDANGLPKSMGAMRSLEVVNLSGNRLDCIPESLLELPKLKQLYLGGNQIDFITPNVKRLQTLEVLYLGGNQLYNVPDEISELRRLKSLNLSDNQLHYVPSSLSKLRRLKSLYLHGNKLRTLPVEIVRLKKLSELSLRNNPLVVHFVATMSYEPPSLLELAGRTIRTERIDYSKMPRMMISYLDSARECVNTRCRGVYFTSRVETVKFVDFCGKFRVPLLQYLCSPHCQCESQRNQSDANASVSKRNSDQLTDSSSSPSSLEDNSRRGETSYLTRMMKKVLLG